MKNKEKHCHYSGLPSPLAYETVKKYRKKKSRKEKTKNEKPE